MIPYDRRYIELAKSRLPKKEIKEISYILLLTLFISIIFLVILFPFTLF